MFASLRRQLGQSGTEYMMVISVVTIAVVGAAFAFVPQFRDGTSQLGADVRDILGSGQGRGAGASATSGGDSVGGDSTGSSATGPSASTGGLGEPTDPTGGAGGGGGNANTGNTNTGNRPARDTRYQRNSQTCVFGVFCFGTRETAIGGGTGGGGGEVTVAQGQAIQEGSDLKNIDGAWKSFFQGDVSKAAAGASDALKDKPICGPSIIAALTGKSVDAAYSELENNGRLALVKKETVVGGVVVSSEYTTTGVMSQNQLALALRQDYGFKVTEKSSGANMTDIQNALTRGATPIVLISDSRSGDSSSGDFGVVTDVVPGMGVKVDSSTGSVWIPQAEFEKRMSAMGDRLITATPPKSGSGPVASKP